MTESSLSFRRSVVTDEISQDLDRAVAMARAFGLAGIEVRSVWGKTIHELTDDQLSRLKRTADAAGLEIAAVDPPFLKCAVDDEDEWREHKRILDRSLRAADRLGARVVRGFTFWRKGELAEYWDQIIAAYDEVRPAIERSGLIVGIENEHSCMVGQSEPLARLVDEIGSPSIRALWDPANGFHAGESITSEICRRVIPLTVHVHWKDARREGDKVEHAIVDEGEVGLDVASRALQELGYTGWVSLETHYRPRHINADFARPSGEAFSEGGEQGTYACLVGWQRLIERVHG